MTILPPNDVGPTRRALRRFLAGVLMTVGGIVALLSGLCSVVFAGGMVFEGGAGRGSLGETLSLGLMVLIVGGVPFAVGFGLFVMGRNGWRSTRRTDGD